MSTNENEYAHPSPFVVSPAGDLIFGSEYSGTGGLTKKECFAIKALQGILSNPASVPGDEHLEFHSELAAKYARTLLAKL